MTGMTCMMDDMVVHLPTLKQVYWCSEHQQPYAECQMDSDEVPLLMYCTTSWHYLGPLVRENNDDG